MVSKILTPGIPFDSVLAVFTHIVKCLNCMVVFRVVEGDEVEGRRMTIANTNALALER